MKNSIVIREPVGKLAGEYECGMLCDLLHLEGARALAVYGKDFYSGMPALTENSFGKGKAYYIAADPEERFLAQFAEFLCEKSAITAPFTVPERVEVVQRYKDDTEFTFILNHNDFPVSIGLGETVYFELLAASEAKEEIRLAPKGVAVLERGI
jgi:beta-galactosidase